MRHYKQMVEGFKRHGFIKKSLNEMDRDHIYRVMLQFSNRIDLLEDFITEETQYDGRKVGIMQFGDTKEKWLKNK